MRYFIKNNLSYVLKNKINSICKEFRGQFKHPLMAVKRLMVKGGRSF
jgi:hypothetical protein